MLTTIVEVRTDGLQLSLADGSVWSIVNTADAALTKLWVPKQRIQVKENRVGDQVLTNLDTVGPDKVVAKPI